MREERIEATVRRLLGQSGVRVEVIVVDDRSRDRTGEILRKLADEDSRVRFVRVEVLPEGWAGKVPRLPSRRRNGRREWILFTDGDSWLQPDLIQRALLVARLEKVEHITMTMGVEPETLGSGPGISLF